MNVKEFIDRGGSLTYPYKKKLLDWYSNSPISLSVTKELSGKPKYIVTHPHKRYRTFDNFDDAWEAFQEDKYNIGVIQGLIMEEHPDWDLYEDIDGEELDIWRKAIRNKRAELKRMDKKSK